MSAQRGTRPGDGGSRRVLTDRAIRAAALAPVLVLGATSLATGTASRPAVVAGALGLVAVLVVGGLTTPRLALLDSDDPPLAPAVIGALGVVFGVVVLTVGFRGRVPPYTVIFGVVIVAAAFALPRRQRGPLIAWSLAGWGAALWLGGVRDVPALATQLGGAVLLSVIALRTTASLEEALRVERRASRASRTRASLLASVLRLQALEPAAVTEAVVRGARDSGFDSALLRVVDGEGLRLVAARPAGGEDPPLRLRLDEGIASIARRTGRSIVVEEYADHPAAIAAPPQLRGAMAVPVSVDGEVAAVLVARRRRRGVAVEQARAIELLAEEAGAALGRARRFAADAATVVELRRLDARTHDFVSTVSHELRTPMTVINGLGQTLERRWDDLDATRRADLLRRIDQNAERLAVMVRSLVDTSALERGELVVRAEPVDVVRCVAAVLERLAPLLDDHPTTIDVPGALTVAADPALLDHVVENLLANAAHHTPPGTPVHVRAAPIAGDEVELEVVDEGPGIDPADLPHVLERFYRAGQPTTRRSGGLGLGLALSSQVLRAHGRELTVASTPGEGTRFSFRLPTADPEAETTPGS